MPGIPDTRHETESARIDIRRLSTHAEYGACVRLQYATWGDSFTECAPPSILMVGQKIGGITGGAFNRAGDLVGFVFSLPGFIGGEHIQWSDLLAVARDWRGCGIGKALKWFQREEALRTGFRYVYWTFDPLEAGNASLNIRTLGARPVSYVPDMYAATNRSSLHAGLSMDRFVVKWDLASSDVFARTKGNFTPPAVGKDAPALLRYDGEGLAPLATGIPHSGAVRIEIPPDIQHVKRRKPDAARAWREVTRTLLTRLLGCGYRIIDFATHPVTHYVLVKD